MKQQVRNLFKRGTRPESARIHRFGSDVAGEHIDAEHLIASTEIVAAHPNTGKRFPRAKDSAQPQRAFGREQIAVLPSTLDLETILGAETNCAGNRAQRRTLKPDVERDFARLIAFGRAGFARGDGNARHQPGGDHRAAQVGFKAFLEPITGVEAGNASKVSPG